MLCIFNQNMTDTLTFLLEILTNALDFSALPLSLTFLPPAMLSNFVVSEWEKTFYYPMPPVDHVTKYKLIYKLAPISRRMTMSKHEETEKWDPASIWDPIQGSEQNEFSVSFLSRTHRFSGKNDVVMARSQGDGSSWERRERKKTLEF